MHLHEWAWRLHEEEKLLDLVDPTFDLTVIELGEMQQAIKLCLTCVQHKAEMRLSMARVVSMLEGKSEWYGKVKRRLLGIPVNLDLG